MFPYEFDAERFSRWMSYVLRHNPTRYGLSHDRHGFVDYDDFFRIATRRYSQVPPDRIRAIIEEGSAGRFELSGSRLRARYGHSISVEPIGEPIKPPCQLYHGSSAGDADMIFAEGLKPMDRRMIHLSESAEDALAVARRKTDQPVVLRINAEAAHESGIAFYREGKIYLAQGIPPAFLSREPLPTESLT